MTFSERDPGNRQKALIIGLFKKNPDKI